MTKHQEVQAAPPVVSSVGQRWVGQHWDASVVRAELDQQRRFRVEQLEELAADAAASSGDDSRRQVARVLTLAAEAALSEIDGALHRLDDRSYGRCERCARTIPWERLEVLPTSRLCTPCQYSAESAKARPRGVAAARPAMPAPCGRAQDGHGPG